MLSERIPYKYHIYAQCRHTIFMHNVMQTLRVTYKPYIIFEMLPC